MIMMPCRLLNLHYVIEGFIRTKVPLILFDGAKLSPFLGFDDIGIYVFIPQLVRLLGINLEQAINLFFYGFVFISFLLSIIGFLLIYKSLVPRCCSIAGLALLMFFLFKFQISDVYLTYVATSLSTIPLFLYFIQKKIESQFFYLFLVISGMLLGTFHYLRAHSGLGALVFIIVMLLFNNIIDYKKKLMLLCCILFGLACPRFYFKSIINTYESYTHIHFPESRKLLTIHPFWHSAYIGFGFLNFWNYDNIQYDDSCACDKVHQRNPLISIDQTEEYEAILQEETILLWKKQPFFVLFTIFAKIGILFLFLLIFSNIGLLAALFFPKSWNLELAFFCSFVINSLFPIMAHPGFWYAIGFITMATLYGIISINEALIKIDFKKYLISYKKLFKNSLITNT